jgi:hypothetical protein
MGRETANITIIGAAGRISRAVKFSYIWAIHKDAVKPKDERGVAGTV